MQEADSAMINVRGFANPEAAEQCVGEDLLPIWEYILNGRAVGRPAALFPYESADGVYRLGFWTQAEVIQLHRRFSARGTLAALVPSESLGAMESARRAVASAYQSGTGLIISVG